MTLQEAKDKTAEKHGYTKGIIGSAWTFFELGNRRRKIVLTLLEEAAELYAQSKVLELNKSDVIKSVCVCKNPKTFQIHKEICYKCTLEVNP
jgi:hypothetical protein